jgi:Tol biopolymer transport system component
MIRARRRLVVVALVGVSFAVTGAAMAVGASRSDDPLGREGRLVEFAINSDGTGKTRITPLGPHISGVNDFPLTRSASGRWFTFIGSLANDESVYADSTDAFPTTAFHRLTHNYPALSEGYVWATPQFSPDERSVAFTGTHWIGGEGCETNCIEPQISVVGVDGGEPRLVALHGRDPFWSADGKWLIYTGHVGNLSDGRDTGVFVVRSDGTERRRIASGLDAVPAPRGKRVVYLCPKKGRPFSGYRVCLANRDGSSKRVLATRLGLSGEWVRPLWSPDASKLAVTTNVNTGDMSRLISISVKDGKRKVLKRGTNAAVALAWSPDEKQIAYLKSFYPESGAGVYVTSALRRTSSRFVTNDPVSLDAVRWSSNTQLTYLTYVHEPGQTRFRGRFPN